MARILIAGCGAIGLQLGTTLQSAGHTVYGLRRSPVTMPFFHIQADLIKPIAPNLLPTDIDYVIYSATPSERSDKAYQCIYPQGLNHLLSSLLQQSGSQPIKRVIFISSTAVYHQDDGSWVDENSPTKPTSFNGKRLLEAEQILLASPIPGTSLRFGGIYGHHRNRLINHIQKETPVQASPPKYTNRIHQDDCVGILAYLIDQQEQNAPLSNCYLGVDHDPAKEWDVHRWIAQQMHLRLPPETNLLHSALSQNKRCSSLRIQQFGYSFRFPTFREGYRMMLKSKLLR